MHLTLAENFRAIFYTPFYLLKKLKLAEEVGLQIDWLPANSPGGAVAQVKEGAIDLTWGGPMRVMKDHDSTPANGASLLCFGEVVSRDPFFLVGSQTNFSLTALTQLRLGLVSEVPTPWLCLQQDLRDLAVDVEKLEVSHSLKRGLTMAQQLERLNEQTLDVAQLFEPYVSQALATGNHSILYAAHTRGPTVYTTFICSRDGFAKKQQAFALLNATLARVQQWMATHSATAIATLVHDYFSELELNLLTTAIDRYRQHNVWAGAPEVSRPGFERLANSLYSGGFIQSLIQYDSCVRTPASDL